jgi:O-antigen/teichoic acid export membrane protein
MSNPILVIAKNIGALTAVNLLGRLLNFAVVAIVARTYGAEGLGGYATATAVSGFFLVLADLGLSSRLVREAARDPDRTGRVYARSMSVKTLTSLTACLVLVGLFFVLPYEPWVRNLIVLLAISWMIRSYTQMNHSVVRAKEHMELEAVSVLVQNVLFIGGALACLLFGFSLVALGWAAIGAALAQLAVSAAIARRFSPLRLTGRPHWQTMRDAAPFSATLLSSIAFGHSNVVVLSLIASQTLVGEFSSVSRVLLLASVVPQLVTLAVVPAFSRVYGRDDAARFRRLTTASLRILLIAAGAGAVALVAASHLVMRLVYGEELESLHPLLQLGTLYLVFQFTSAPLGMALTAAGRQGARARAIVIALAATVPMILVLTPLLGVLGAVIALVASQLVLAVASAVPLRDLLAPGDLFRNAAWVAAAGGLAVACHFWLAAAGQPLLAVVAPLAVYPAVLLPSGELPKLLEIARQRH